MAGHISYPRTAAAEHAWARYRDAVTLANAGAKEPAKRMLRAMLDDPDASSDLKPLALDLLMKLNAEAIAEALESHDPGDRFEGEAASLIMKAGFSLYSFERKIGPNGCIGEIDIETDRFIIETTLQKRGKKGQIERYMTSREINPDQKAVVLYAPNHDSKAAAVIRATGALFAGSQEELMALLRAQSLKDA